MHGCSDFPCRRWNILYDTIPSLIMFPTKLQHLSVTSWSPEAGRWQDPGSKHAARTVRTDNWEPAARLSAVCDKTKRTSAITSDTWQLSGALLFSCTWCKSKSGKIICTPLSHVALPLYGSMISPFSSPELHGANCRLKVAMLLSLR